MNKIDYVMTKGDETEAVLADGVSITVSKTSDGKVYVEMCRPGEEYAPAPYFPWGVSLTPDEAIALMRALKEQVG